MQFGFERMGALERYKLLLATVLLRPIAWVTTGDAAGAINAEPFSFFNVFGSDPATVGIGIGSKGPAEPKDTRANIRVAPSGLDLDEAGERLPSESRASCARRSIASVPRRASRGAPVMAASQLKGTEGAFVLCVGLLRVSK